MTDPGFPIAALPRIVATCAECGVPLAPDQRYCVSCGTRCAPLPVGLLGMVTAAGGRLAPAAVGASATIAATVEGRAAAFLSTLPPRAAALAVMSMLAFGVVIGSGATSLASPGAPLILAYAPPQPAAAAPSAAAPAAAAPSSGGGSGGSGSGGGGTTTVVQTVAAQTLTAPGAGSSPGGGGGGAPAPTAPTGSTLPPIKHVFLIMLSSQGFKQLYGPGSPFPYLAHTLRRRGELLDNYYGVAGSPLANGVAMISGQGPTQQTMLDCPQYTAITPGTLGKGKQTQGDGCVYPVTAQNLPDQLTANGQTWKAYVEGMSTVAPAPAAGVGTTSTGSGTTPTAAAGGGTTTASATAPTSASTPTQSTTSASSSTPAATETACRRPTIGTADADQTAGAASPYVTWRNPFVYFQSIAQATICAQQDVSLEHLATDLRHATTTPTLAYIAPSPCDDGSEVPCTPGRPADPKAAAAATDAFLKTTITEIEASPAYKAGGLIAITADNAPQNGPQADPSACCNTPAYPNLPATTTTGTTTGTTSTGTTSSATGTTTSATTPVTPTTSSTTTAPLAGGQTTATGGGGQVGMLLLSKYVKPGSADTLDYFDHYSLLASIEQLFSLPRLGYASDPQLTLFTTGVVYNAYSG